MNLRTLMISLILSCTVLAGCGQITDVTTIRLAHSMSTTHPVHLGMVRMAELVDEYSEGKMKVLIYPNSQLGTERETLEMLQIGSIGITKVTSAVLENFIPEIRVFSLPYLFRDMDHVHTVLDGEIGNELLLAGEHVWLRGLTFYDAGARSFYFKDRAIHSPEDLRGMKIRVMESQMAISMIQTMGGSPTPIPLGELYTALQQGVVDGAENNLPSFLTLRHYEVARFLSLDEHLVLPDVLLISTHIWNELTLTEQNWLQLAADSSAKYQRALWSEAEEEALRLVKEDGVTIIYPDKTPFQEITAGLFGRFETSEPDFFRLIQRIRQTESIYETTDR